MSVTTYIAVIAAVWITLAVAGAVLLGKGVRRADDRLAQETALLSQQQVDQ